MSYGPMWRSKRFTAFISGYDGIHEDVTEFLNEQNLSINDFFITETFVTGEDIPVGPADIFITVWYRKRMSKSDVIKEIKELKYLREELEKNKNNIKNKKIKEIEKELEETEKKLAENIEKTEKELAGEIKETDEKLVGGRQVH